MAITGLTPKTFFINNNYKNMLIFTLGNKYLWNACCGNVLSVGSNSPGIIWTSTVD